MQNKLQPTGPDNNDNRVTPLQTRPQRLAEHLAGSGLTPDQCPGWSCVSGRDAAAALGREKPLRGDAILIPYRSLDGEDVVDCGLPYVRVRLLAQTDQDALDAKYLAPAGSSAHAYLHHGLADLLPEAGLLVITEGEKKAAAAVCAGIACVGLGGVDMWRTQGGDVLPDLLAIIERTPPQAPAVVLFDSDAESNPRVQSAAKKLAAALCDALPDRPVAAAFCPKNEDSKQGLDDWLVRAGADAVRAALSDIAATATTREQAIEAARRARLDALPFHPLGVSPDGAHLHLRIKSTKEIVALPARELTAARLVATLGAEYVEQNFVEYNEETGRGTFSPLLAAMLLAGICQQAGVWSDDKQRGAGVWRDAETSRVLLNAVEGLYVLAERTAKPLNDDDRVSGGVVYTQIRLGATVVARAAPLLTPPAESPVAGLLAHIQGWGHTTTTAPYLLAVWVACAHLLPALPVRPHVWIYGRAGAGKTELAKHLAAATRGGRFVIDGGAAAHTAAGIRQSLGACSLPIIFDEAEIHTSTDPRQTDRARAVVSWSVAQARAGYTAGGDESTIASSRGTPGGKAQQNQAVNSWCWLSISPPDLQEADRGRMVLLELTAENRPAKTPPPVAEAEGLGAAARAWMTAHFSDLEQALDWLRGDEQAAALVPSGRLRSTWGVFVAAWLVLKHGATWAEHKAEALETLARVRDEQGENDNGEIDSMGERLFTAILTLPIKFVDARGRVREGAVGDFLAHARVPSRGHSDWPHEAALRAMGVVRVAENQVFVAGQHEQLQRALGQKWSDANVSKLLSQIRGAKIAGVGKGAAFPRQRVGGGVLASGVVLPIPHSVLDAPPLTGSEDNDENNNS